MTTPTDCPFEVGETYETRDGEELTVLLFDPLLHPEGRLLLRDKRGRLRVRHADGRLSAGKDSYVDLAKPIEIPED